jgi:hypothetical protein
MIRDGDTMRIKIFTSYHFVPEHYIANELYAPLVMGHAIGHHPVLVSDQWGANIAGQASYCEMRGQYYVWKNLLSAYDYVGFQHYRRMIFFDQMPLAAHDPLLLQVRRAYLRDPLTIELKTDASFFQAYQDALQRLGQTDIEALRELIGSHDIITLRPWPCSLAEQYRSTHVPGDWDALVHILTQHPRFRGRPNHLDFDLKMLYSCNMYVMRAEEFDAYMSFWHETMREFTKLVKPHADPYQSRVYGFISERIFTLYLYQLRMERPQLRIIALPYVTGPQNP